jgi:hypothetical protein
MKVRLLNETHIWNICGSGVFFKASVMTALVRMELVVHEVQKPFLMLLLLVHYQVNDTRPTNWFTTKKIHDNH